MNCSDWISIICAGVSLVVTIIIACLQFWQSSRINKLERRQDERDEQRHAESVKAQAVSFISKHYSNRGLIPLCAIAAMHNDLFYYSREMYREFCCMTLEVQNRILEYCELDLRVKEVDGLFEKCIKEMEKVFHEFFPNDHSPFYEGAKYVLRSLEEYGNQEIPILYIKYRPSYKDPNMVAGKIFSSGFDGTAPYHMCIDDTLQCAKGGNHSKKTFKKMEDIYEVSGSFGIEACQFLTTLAQYLAMYGNKNSDSKKDYGHPEDSNNMNTMEDLFLLSVFHMYTELVLNGTE